MRMPPEPGQLIGRYRLTRELGRGAMGQVFLAEDTVLQQPVCLKLLHSHYLHHTEAVARFTRELVLARRISHPGVCRVYDLHDEGGLRFLTMEFIDGEPLKSLVGRGAPVISVARALRLTRNLCLGLAAAHDKGVVHRDLKPGNIMVRAGSDDHVCILDFGIAAAADTAAQGLTRPGVALGTRLYIAPEVWAGQPATTRSDLFAVGVILFRLLTGEMPWVDGENDLDVVDRMRREAPRRVSGLRPEVDPAVDAVVASALAVDPAARISDAHTLVALIDEALRGLPVPGTGRDAETRVERPAHGVVDDVSSSSSSSSGGTRWRSVPVTMTPLSPTESTRSITEPIADDEATREAWLEPPVTTGEDSWVVAGRPVGNPVRPKVMAVPERPAALPLSSSLSSSTSATGGRGVVALVAVVAVVVAVAAVVLWPVAATAPSSPAVATDTPVELLSPLPPVEVPPPPPRVEVPPPPPRVEVSSPPPQVEVSSPPPPVEVPSPPPQVEVSSPPPPVEVPSPPPPVEVPLSPPVSSTKPVATGSSAKKNATRALKDIVAAMRTRGVVTGDDAELDQLRRAAVRAQAGRRHEVALERAEAAIARAAAVRIDRALVERKLTRFNDAFDREKSATIRARLDEIAGRASLDFAAGRFDAANRALNEGFALLGKDR